MAQQRTSAQGHKNRGFTSRIIFNRLAIHADNKAECDAVELAKMYKAVELLCTEERWKAMSKLPIHPLTIGKLLDIAKLVERVEGSELYACFDPARLEDAKALFVWACGDGIDKPARADIAARVLELKDPEEFAEQQAKEAQRKDTSAMEISETDLTKAYCDLLQLIVGRTLPARIVARLPHTVGEMNHESIHLIQLVR